MKRSPFKPSLFIRAQEHTGLHWLLLNRLPKNISVFSTFSWSDDAIMIAQESAKIHVVIISPSGHSKSKLEEDLAFIRSNKTKPLVLLSRTTEQGHWFSESEFNEIHKRLSLEPCIIFTELNKLTNYIRKQL